MNGVTSAPAIAESRRHLKAVTRTLSADYHNDVQYVYYKIK